ncbi:hypothetical protein ACFLXG_03080 [Chloroflexota bacterium]
MTLKHFVSKERELAIKGEPFPYLDAFEIFNRSWKKEERPRLMRHFPDMSSAMLSNWSQDVSSHFRRELEYEEGLTELRSTVDDLASGVQTLGQDLSACKECIDKLYSEFMDRPIVKETRLFDISEDLEVLTSIPIVIEETDDEVVASFPEVEVFAVGTGEAEAINKLKKAVEDLFSELIDTPDEKLGKVPLSWKRVLTKVVRRVGKA